MVPLPSKSLIFFIFPFFIFYSFIFIYLFLFFFFFFENLSVSIMIWTSAHHAFAGETIFFKTGESVIAIERAFRAYLILHKNDAVSTHNIVSFLSGTASF